MDGWMYVCMEMYGMYGMAWHVYMYGCVNAECIHAGSLSSPDLARKGSRKASVSSAVVTYHGLIDGFKTGKSMGILVPT